MVAPPTPRLTDIVEAIELIRRKVAGATLRSQAALFSLAARLMIAGAEIRGKARGLV